MRNDAIFSIKLNEGAAISAGYPLRSSADALESGDVRFIQLRNVSLDADVDWNDVAKVSLPSKKEPAWLSENDVLFSARGTRTLAYALPGVPPRTVCGPQFFVLSVRDPEQLCPEFLAWQINQKPTQDYLQRSATGAHILNIRKAVLEDLPVVVPPRHEQELIVAFWQAARHERAALNKLIENRNTQLEALASALFQRKGG